MREFHASRKKKMAERKKIPKTVESDVLYKSDFKCCVCQDGTQGVHVHHIDENPNNNKLNNLAFLCFYHHDEASKKGSLSKKLTPRTIKKFRDNWYEEITEIRKKRREYRSTPLTEVSEEHLTNAALSANIIIEIIKIREAYLDGDWNERKEILDKVHQFADYSNFRISYEVYMFLTNVISEIRSGLSSRIISSVYWLVSTFYLSGDEDKDDTLSKMAINMARTIIYDATIYRDDLDMVAYGCNILKLVYQNNSEENKEDLRTKIREVYKRLEGLFKDRKENDYSKSLNVMNVFKNDLDNWGLSFPRY